MKLNIELSFGDATLLILRWAEDASENAGRARPNVRSFRRELLLKTTLLPLLILTLLSLRVGEKAVARTRLASGPEPEKTLL